MLSFHEKISEVKCPDKAITSVEMQQLQSSVQELKKYLEEESEARMKKELFEVLDEPLYKPSMNLLTNGEKVAEPGWMRDLEEIPQSPIYEKNRTIILQ